MSVETAALAPEGSQATLRFALVGALIIFVVMLYWPTAIALHELWTDTARTTYAHGYLIAGISVWVLWHRRTWLSTVALTPFAPALLGLLGSAILWSFADYAGIGFVNTMLLPGILWMAVLTIWGWAAARLVLFPFAYLYFALTIWDFANPIAQWGTVYAVRLLVQAIGIPTFFDGNRVQIPEGTFEIAGGCSGLHFIIVGLALSTLLGEIRGDRWRTRSKLIVLMLALSIVSNWLRVTVLIIIGHLTSMQHYLVKVSHYGFGWCVFAVALIAFFVFERRIALDPLARTTFTGDSESRTPQFLLIALASILVMAGPIVVDAAIRARTPGDAPAPLPHVKGWNGPASSVAVRWQPISDNADGEALATYANDVTTLEVYSAWYVSQTQGKELGGTRNSVAGALESGDVATVVGVGGAKFLRQNVTAGAEHFVLWYAYGVAGRWFTDPRRAQIFYALNTLSNLSSSRSRVLAVLAPCAADCSTASLTASRFIADLTTRTEN